VQEISLNGNLVKLSYRNRIGILESGFNTDLKKWFIVIANPGGHARRGAGRYGNAALFAVPDEEFLRPRVSSQPDEDGIY
jgi:hypothetical protein